MQSTNPQPSAADILARSPLITNPVKTIAAGIIAAIVMAAALAVVGAVLTYPLWHR